MTELLMRFVSTPILVVLDDVPRHVFERLRTDSEFRKDAERNKQVELRELD